MVRPREPDERDVVRFERPAERRVGVGPRGCGRRELRRRVRLGEAARQYEAVPIRDDGSFSVALKFSGVTKETPVSVATPAFSTTAPLGELADGTITGSE